MPKSGQDTELLNTTSTLNSQQQSWKGVNYMRIPEGKRVSVHESAVGEARMPVGGCHGLFLSAPSARLWIGLRARDLSTKRHVLSLHQAK